MQRAVVVLVAIVFFAIAFLYAAGSGWFGSEPDAGEVTGAAIPASLLTARKQADFSSADNLGVVRPKQILFGDLHVHSTFSPDAFQASLPMTGGEGAHPVGDACDFARYCSALDFFSINDHAEGLTSRRWQETKESIRACNAVAGDAANPDLVAFLGWEWTQVGSTPENHWGHKNVVLRDTEEEQVPARPISAGAVSEDAELIQPPGTLTVGLGAVAGIGGGGMDLAAYLDELFDAERCEQGKSVRDLPSDCMESASTPKELFSKLDDWGFPALVIPHGTTWGMYTPPGSAWDKQLTPEYVGEARQRIVEVFSGHGNSEEYRKFREVILKDDGTRECPQPTRDFLPGCWQAGEIIRARCLADGDDEEDCEEAAVEARRNFVNADRNGGGATVPGGTVEEWKDAGQCRDCFQPAFNYRPRSSVQYILALAKQQGGSEPLRFEMGFIASSDNHSARPGTGYKEIARSEFTEARFGTFVNTPLALGIEKESKPESVEFDATTSNPPFAFWETERAGSFFLNGGLAAVHSNGRDRQSIWEALERKEVYGTSGPRILLWFDLLNGPGSLGQTVPMGGSAQLGEAPIFQVRAVGSFEQKPGCPEHATTGLDADRLAKLCHDECYYPSDRRRVITRIEVVRIRPQLQSGESVDGLIEDPWRSFACQPDPAGCSVTFTDADFGSGARSALYYVRAVESPSLAVGANPLGCEYDAQGNCVKMDPCGSRPNSDDCLAQTEERAWSSPIWIDYAPGAGPIAAAAPPLPR